MLRVAAIISFYLSVVFYVWNITHGRWTYTLFALLGLALWCLSDKCDWHP
jgi:hypothetical protein